MPSLFVQITAWLAVAMSAAAASPCHLAIAARLGLQHDSRLIEGQIDANPVRLKLDTGAFSTILTPQAVKRLGLRADPDRPAHPPGEPDEAWGIAGVGGVRTGQEVMAHRFDLGSLHGINFHFLTADIGNVGADGLLSTDFLQDYDIDLDYAGHEIRLFRATGDCDRPPVYLQPPLYTVPLVRGNAGASPRIRVFIDGRRLTAILDTGADQTAIFRDAARRLGISGDAPAPQARFLVHGVGPLEAPVKIHRVQALRIGDLTLVNIPVVVLDDRNLGDVDILLGADIQRRLHFWISNAAHTLVIQYPQVPSPDIP
jgi:predicted aspartyl protease